jgi:hypothetical protein
VWGVDQQPEHVLIVKKSFPLLCTVCLPALLTGVRERPGRLWLLSENCGDASRGLSYSSHCQMFTFAAICAGGRNKAGSFMSLSFSQASPINAVAARAAATT